MAFVAQNIDDDLFCATITSETLVFEAASADDFVAEIQVSAGATISSVALIKGDGTANVTLALNVSTYEGSVTYATAGSYLARVAVTLSTGQVLYQDFIVTVNV